MSEHTKTPWKVYRCSYADEIGENSGDHSCGIGSEEDNDVICDTNREECRHSILTANAEFIVRAVNSHETLLEAAKKLDTALSEARELLGLFEDNGGHDGLGGEAYRVTIDHMDYARRFYKAIALAEKKPEVRP